jgi:hypothetical protein
MNNEIRKDLEMAGASVKLFSIFLCREYGNLSMVAGMGTMQVLKS